MRCKYKNISLAGYMQVGMPNNLLVKQNSHLLVNTLQSLLFDINDE